MDERIGKKWKPRPLEPFKPENLVARPRTLPKKEVGMTDKTKAGVPSIVQAKDFLHYCERHPEQRFWQALRNWAGVSYVGVSNDRAVWVDTFHFKDDVARRYGDKDV